MKPTVQNGRPARLSDALRPAPQVNKRPITDWAFQPVGTDLRGGSLPFHPGASRVSFRPGFHTLSQGFFSAEANTESRVEGAVFGLMVVLAAWPIALAVQAAATLLR